MPEIVLPHMPDDQAEKFKEAVRSIGNCMDAEITIDTITSLRVCWPNNRGDVGIILNDLAGTKSKRSRGPNKPRSISLARKLSEEKFDPLGS